MAKLSTSHHEAFAEAIDLLEQLIDLVDAEDIPGAALLAQVEAKIEEADALIP